MNHSEHHISREAVVLYFLDELNSADRKRVQLAVRNDPELKEYYLKQLNIFASVNFKEGLSDEDGEFIRYLGLSIDDCTMNMKAQAFQGESQSTIEEKDSGAQGILGTIPFRTTFIAKHQANRRAANDRPPVLEPFQTQESVDELVWLWKPGSNDYDTIVLKFSSGHKELGNTITMQVDVEWRQGSNGDLNRSELQQVSLMRKRNSKVNEWEGELCLRPFMQDNETVESITTVQGTLNE